MTRQDKLYLAQMPPFEATNQPLWELLMAHQDPKWQAGQLAYAKAKGWAAPDVLALDLPQWANLVDEMPLTEQAQWWLGLTVLPLVGQGNTAMGGGYWWAGSRIVILASYQIEARIHECAHAWGEALLGEQPDLQDEFLAALVWWTRWPLFDWGFSADYKRMRNLVRGYVNGAPGIPDGFVRPRMWSEAYASLASGFQGNWKAVPAELAVFYRGLFRM